MTLFDMPNYLWITTLIMILLTIFSQVQTPV